jgi:hypothetical protein
LKKRERRSSLKVQLDTRIGGSLAIRKNQGNKQDRPVTTVPPHLSRQPTGYIREARHAGNKPP